MPFPVISSAEFSSVGNIVDLNEWKIKEKLIKMNYFSQLHAANIQNECFNSSIAHRKFID